MREDWHIFGGKGNPDLNFREFPLCHCGGRLERGEAEGGQKYEMPQNGQVQAGRRC